MASYRLALFGFFGLAVFLILVSLLATQQYHRPTTLHVDASGFEQLAEETHGGVQDEQRTKSNGVSTARHVTSQRTDLKSTAVTKLDLLNAVIPLAKLTYDDANVTDEVKRRMNEMYMDFYRQGLIINEDITRSNVEIPNIYHYVRFNQPNMRFHEMLSIKSVLKLSSPEAVYIHCNKKPEGKYWNMVKGDQRVHIKSLEPPTSIFGKEFGWVQHGSDLARIQILLKYGGIYLDNDCIVINEFERVRKHHCVASKAADERHIGNMVLMGVKQCVFLQMYEELYRLDYRKDAWYYNGGELPTYAIADQYPGIVYLADEGVQQGVMHVLWNSDLPLSFMQKYWRIIHLFYGHKDYTYNDITDYNETNIRAKKNGFSRLARWIYYDHEDPFTD